MDKLVKEMKELLLKKRETLLAQVELLTKDKVMSDGPLESDLDDQAITLENHQVVDALDELERKELKEIEYALKRIEEGTYGRCVVDGEPIEEKRLRAMPYAKTCIEHTK